MLQNKTIITERKTLFKQNKFKLLLIILSFSTIFAQSVTSVDPNLF